MLPLSYTSCAQGKPIRGGYLQPVNTAHGGLSCTINTRYEAIGQNNILSLAHYPMTVILQEYGI